MTVVSESGMNDVVEVTDCDAVEAVKISEVGCARASLVVVTYIFPPTWLSTKFAKSNTKTTLPDGASEMKLHISFPVNLVTKRVHLTCIIPVMHYSEQEQIANEIIQILSMGRSNNVQNYFHAQMPISILQKLQGGNYIQQWPRTSLVALDKRKC